ncbi:MAG: bifunctional phosphoglucose/phosphomannose isomerase, partial [Armatimonadota bacterium]
RELAQAFHGKLPILYGLGFWQGLIANRWKCQINENAKCHAFFHTYPELDHNEILGWIGAHSQAAQYHGAALVAPDASAKMRTRHKVTERLIGPQCPFTTVEAQGNDLLSQMLSLTYFGDFVSMYLSALNGADPTTIPHIDTLKAELEKVA